MLIVTGALVATFDTFERLKAECLAHTRRSRAEPGCIGHDVFIDAENPYRLFFFERWESRAALDAHFREPGSAAFMRAARALSSSSVGPEIFEVAS